MLSFHCPIPLSAAPVTGHSVECVHVCYLVFNIMTIILSQTDMAGHSSPPPSLSPRSASYSADLKQIVNYSITSHYELPIHGLGKSTNGRRVSTCMCLPIHCEVE